MASASVRRRLEALECPFLKEIDFEDMNCLQRLVCWLEDVHIRFYEISERKCLRLKEFLPFFQQYLYEMKYDQDVKQVSDLLQVRKAVEWLIKKAIRLTYSEKWEMLNEPVDIWQGNSISIVQGIAKDDKIARVVVDLLKVMNIDQTKWTGGTAERLAAVSKLLSQVMKESESSANELDVDVEKYERESNQLEDVSLGFKEDDSTVENAAKVLRLLHVADLRELQNGVNELIGDMQRVTANPITNTALGKVGR